jgi:AhpD family alkylhydroperoxidase
VTRFPIHDLETAPDESKAGLEAAHKKFGMIGNLPAQLAHSPAALNAYQVMKATLIQQGVLDPVVQEAIALAVGGVNDCHYCQSSHTWAAIHHGLTLEQTVACRDGDVDWDPKLAAIIAVVREAAEFVGDVSDETWDNALAAGWTLEEMAEAGAHVAANLFTNYFNHYARTELGKLKPAPGIPVVD